MKEWLVTLGCVLAALALFYTLFVPQPAPEADRYSQPTSRDQGDNGYAAAMHWLEGVGVRVVSLRRRYDSLARGEPLLEGTGNLLITTMPHAAAVRETEGYLLRNWIERGNTVLVLAALADTPDWTMVHVARDLPQEIRELTGVGFFVPVDYDVAAESQEAGEQVADVLKRLGKRRPHRIAPNRRHPLFEGVNTIAAESEFPASQWQAAPAANEAVLSLAHDADTGRDALWVRHRGQGRLVISAYGSLFANEQLSHGDNARLLANLVAQSLGPKGSVVFDDQHQGVSELYDGSAFFADRRLHITLCLLLGLWFVWALGSTRLRIRAAPTAPRETAFVEATGGFLARVTDPLQAAARLLQHFFNDIHRRLGRAPDGSPPWEWLDRQPRISRADLQALRAAHQRIGARRKIDLVQLQNLLVRMQGRL